MLSLLSVMFLPGAAGQLVFFTNYSRLVIKKSTFTLDLNKSHLANDLWLNEALHRCSSSLLEHRWTPNSFQYVDRRSRTVISCFHLHTFCVLVRIWLLNDPQWNHRWFIQGFRCVKTNIASSRDEERGRQSSGLPTYFWLIFKTCGPQIQRQFIRSV